MEILKKHIEEFERPKRKAISSRFPILVTPAILTKRAIRSIQNKFTLKKLRKEDPLSCVVARHSSPLFRKLGDSDMELQKNKIENLKIAISKLDGLVIPPGEIFSFWDCVGEASRKAGYVEGMLLSNGKVSKGIGGGLCQLSNFLMWIFLHTDIEIIERHHHSIDAFPDSGRTLPFGGGATIFSNYLDLKIKNASDRPIQIKLWLTDSALKGQLLSDQPQKNKYHVFEKNHCFVNRKGKYFRFNEIYRETHEKGVLVKEEKIFTNFAPVAYSVSDEKLRELGYKIETFN
jgi:vancomycin resistance protein VanW